MTRGTLLASMLPPPATRSTRRSAVDRLLPLRESVGELPIKSPKDEWTTIRMQDGVHIQRTFELRPNELKMLVCDAIDVQEQLGHEIQILISGGEVTIRSTTHEHGEPTERDREVARHIDAAYTEVREAYR